MRSAPNCSSARLPPAPTSATQWRNSVRETAHSWSSSRTRPAWSTRTRDPPGCSARSHTIVFAVPVPDCVCRGMTGRYVQEMEIINLGTAEGLPPVDWAAVVEKLDAGSAPAPDGANSRTTWLSTVNEDGSPHVTAVGALWLDGMFWFQTGAGTRKGRNVARDPRCSIAVSVRDADVVFEGDAGRVTEPGALARVAKAWADNGCTVEPDVSRAGNTT